MPILLDVGRKSRAQRTVRIGIYGLLTLGAIGIIYPVLIVMGQTLSNDFELRDNAIVPSYLVNRNQLLLKHVFSYTKKLDLLASRHNRNSWSNQLRMRTDTGYVRVLPGIFRRQGLNLDARETVVADLEAFKDTLDPDRLIVVDFRIEDAYRPFLRERYGAKADAFLESYGETGRLPTWFTMMFPEERERRRILRKRDRLGLAIMNHDLRSDYLNYYGVEVMPTGNVVVPFWRPGDSPKERLWSDFKATLPPSRKLIVSSDAYWHTYLKLAYHQIEDLNRAWGTEYEGFYETHVPLSPPEDPARREAWETFIIERWPRDLLRLPTHYAQQYRAYVRRQLLVKAEGVVDPEKEALRRAARLVGRPISDWHELPFAETRPADDTLSRYWCELTSSGNIRAEDMILLAPELTFRTFLEKRYAGTGQEPLEALNQAWMTAYESFDDVPLPLRFYDFVPVRFTPVRLRLSYAVESYQRVFEYLIGRGRAAQNTLILVLLSLVSALTINPIAAYSLSRFPMRHTQKVLIFFLATMAFPAEVAMIPNFLLLRDLGLLNTYAALILPRMANGFAIFLLKGFFDSLPQELYQAAEIDGAGEIQIFRMVAMPLVLPILAFIGLNTFVLAYSSFMWAFVICPKQEMWTLMVWVYDFQMNNPGNNYVMAATVLVSIPPLIVFLFVNRIIMRGIVIPSMK